MNGNVPNDLIMTHEMITESPLGVLAEQVGVSSDFAAALLAQAGDLDVHHSTRPNRERDSDARYMDSSLFDTDTTLHILYEQEAHLYTMTVPKQPPDSAMWDCAATLFAVPSAAMLSQSSLRRLATPLVIRGATGTTQASLIGRPINMREALSQDAVVISGLHEHIIPLGRATQANKDGHRSIFVLTDTGGRHILLSDTHIMNIVTKFFVEVQGHVIGTAELVNNLYREFHEGPGFEEAKLAYSANLAARINTMSLAPVASDSTSTNLNSSNHLWKQALHREIDQLIDNNVMEELPKDARGEYISPTNLDAGISMLANTRQAKAASST